jgi:hypothetical protein
MKHPPQVVLTCIHSLDLQSARQKVSQLFNKTWNNHIEELLQGFIFRIPLSIPIESMMIFVFYLVLSTTLYSETTGNGLDEFESTILPSTFSACQGPRVSRTQGLPRTPESAARSWQQTRSFYEELYERVESRAKSNLARSRQMRGCFFPLNYELRSSPCTQIRNWVDPRRYPMTGENATALEDSLRFNIRRARLNLALANDSGNLQSLSRLNTSLDPEGFKAVNWNPLSQPELESVQETLESYIESFRRNNNLSAQQFQEIFTGYDSRSDIREQGDLTFPSHGQERHQRLQAEFIDEVGEVRRQHLNFYRYIVSQYPIINFLTSEEPAPSEIYVASLRMIKNAEAELSQIQNDRRSIPTDDNYIPNRVRGVLDYRQIVEEFLAENPEYCRIALLEDQSRQRVRRTRSALVLAPVLATAVAAPPLPAMAVGALASAGYTYTAYRDFQSEKQSAYSAPQNDGSLRSSQQTVDGAQSFYHRRLRMLPVDAIVTGLMSGGPRLLRRTREGVPNNSDR